MKVGDRVRFTAESILWLYYKELWPDSVGVIDREIPDSRHTVLDRIDVRFPDGTVLSNEPKCHFKAA